MDYLAYHFNVEPPQPGSEILMAAIAELGFESFEQTESGFTAWLPAKLEEQVELENIVFPSFSYSFTIERIAARNWNAEWEQNFEPVIIDRLLCIRAPFHHAVDHGCEREIVIMPKMSFGTGHHQTTRLMCKQMSKLSLKGRKVLDMGCGTAVLAIYARQLGADSAVAIDNDRWSVENAIENCASNGFGDIRVIEGSEPLGEQYGLVLANINRNVLRTQMPQYAKVLAEQGKLLLSGFFVTDREELCRAAETAGLQFEESLSEENWMMLQFVKKGS